jgi:vacuolar-type H+-ATPase subunit H
MDQEQAFYNDVTVDRTPYSAFSWIILTAVIFTIAGGYGLWQLGSAFKSQDWLRSSKESAAGISLPNVDIESDNILNQARQAAQQAAQEAAEKAAREAAARATQELLQQGEQEIKKAAQSAAPSGADTLQQYLQQP